MKHPSDSEKLHQAANENERLKRAEQLMLKYDQKTRWNARKTERELLQCASSQALTEGADLDIVHEISNANPSLATECLLRKSLTFKDPTKFEHADSVQFHKDTSIELSISL